MNYSELRLSLSKRLMVLFPEFMSKRRYKSGIGRPMDINNPKAMTEKLMYLKLRKYWNNPLVALCADKYRVRDYIKEKGCPELLTELYGSWDKVEDIDWNSLPKKFVIKCNHGSGYNLVVKNKDELDIIAAEKTINEWMNDRYGLKAAEHGIYDLIPRKIIAEEFIETADGMPPKDFKFFCSFGKVVLLFVATDRIDNQTKFDFYYPDWTHIPVRNTVPMNGPIPKPENLDEMISYAEKLSTDFPMVRVDFYNEAGKIYFGELTFTHFGCINGFDPDSYDFEFGKLFPDAEELEKWNSNK